jgi:YhcH/YjgK/YiaL family protein
MILDLLSVSERYESLSPRFAKAFRWLRACEPTTLPDGKTSIDGDDVFVLVQRGLTKPLEQVKWEAHRNYADIQYVVTSREEMRWEALSRTRPGAYVAEKDFVPLDTDTWSTFEVSAGTFAVFFPHDAHRPGILVVGAEPVVKLVVKVRV